MALASKLPLELLSDIFLMIRDDPPRINLNWHDHWMRLQYGFAAGWIPATWVCRRWREAALKRRALWTKFTIQYLIRDPEAIHTFLSRAHDTHLLQVAVHLKERRTDTAFRALANAFDHLQRWVPRIGFLALWMKNTPRQVMEINRFLGTLGPALTTLAVGSWSEPRARPLHLQGLTNLHTLYLGWLPLVEAPLPSIPRIIINEVFTARPGSLQTFLTACTGVVELDISDALPIRIGRDDPSDFDTVHLPTLALLRLHREAPDAARVALSGFRLPPTASLEIETRLDRPNRSRELIRRDAWLRRTLPENLDDLGVLSNTHSLTVRIDDGISDDVCDGSTLNVKLHGEAGAAWSQEPHWSLEGSYAGGVSALSRHRHWRQFLLSLSLIVRPEVLVRLELHCADWLPLAREWTWWELFGQLSSLRALVVGGWECIEATTRTLEADLTLLPVLQVLSLCIAGEPTHRDAGQAMIRWFKARHEEGSGVEGLVLRVGGRATYEAMEVLIKGLVSHAAKEVPWLMVEIEVVKEEDNICLSCSWSAAETQRERRESDDWGWDAPTDTEPDDEGSETDSREDDFYTSDSESEDDEEADLGDGGDDEESGGEEADE